jgi:hypothetical protein
MKETTIELVALDRNGCEVERNDVFETRKQARERAKVMLDNAELVEAGMRKIELRINGECINDWFVKNPKKTVVERMMELAGDEIEGDKEFYIFNKDGARGASLFLSGSPYLFSGFAERAYIFGSEQQALALIAEFPVELVRCEVGSRERVRS